MHLELIDLFLAESIEQNSLPPMKLNEITLKGELYVILFLDQALFDLWLNEVFESHCISWLADIFSGISFYTFVFQICQSYAASDIKLHFTHAHILLFNTRLVNVDKNMSLRMCTWIVLWVFSFHLNPNSFLFLMNDISLDFS